MTSAQLTFQRIPAGLGPATNRIPFPVTPIVGLRSLALFAAGAMPVLSIPLHVAGLLQLRVAALILVIPLAMVTVLLIRAGSREANWAGRGLLAGLVAVAMYDAVRMPMVWTGIWPDFIPALGGWITGAGGENASVGYLWRYLGDGGGIGMAYFVFCAAVYSLRPTWVSRRPLLLSVSYGVFIWTGLVGTVAVLPRGEEMMFSLTPASLGLSLLGHLIYGMTLGLFLRRICQESPRDLPLSLHFLPFAVRRALGSARRPE
ncbi:hypothetical protein [Kribbella deserti]|uniref:Uncharacterized protein n=1 Tax=Kribbella deserti TaxID=1926257 RepID=A0ABV6QN00_9ACTN